MASIGKIGKIDHSDLQQKVSGLSSPVRSPSPADVADLSPSPTRISKAGKLQHTLSHLTDTVRRLSQASTWQASKAISSEPEVLDATTQQADTAQKIDVQVDQVAAAQTTVAATFSPLATTIGLGTLNIEVGHWDKSFSTFTTNPNWPKASVMTGPGDTSVARLRDKINGAGVGVIANVISDATGTYLILRASAAGRENGFRITATPSPEANAQQAQALKDLEFDPAGNPNGMQLTQAAQDALLRVNGQAIQSSSNFMEDVVPGVDITAKKASSQPVSVAIKPDRDTGKSLVENFVRTYNELDTELGDPASGNAAIVESAKQIQQKVRAIWQDEAQPSDLRQGLEKLGIKLDKTRQQLTLDSTALDQGLSSRTSPDLPLTQLARILNSAEQNSPSATAATQSTPSTPPPDSSRTTSVLFRQAVLEQYTNNMYAEDAH